MLVENTVCQSWCVFETRVSHVQLDKLGCCRGLVANCSVIFLCR